MEITFRNQKYCLEKIEHKDLMDLKFLLETIKVDLKNDLIVLENQRNPKAPKEEVQILKYKNHKIGLNIHAINYELNKRRERDKNFAQKKELKPKTINDYFVEVAKEKMNEDDFNYYMDLAYQIKNNF